MMHKSMMIFLLGVGIYFTSCKEPCQTDEFDGHRIEVNLDPNRDYLTASGQMIGIIKVAIKNANGQVVDGDGLGISFNISGGGTVKDWEGKDFSDNFAPVSNQFTELQWSMGEELGANQLTLELAKKTKISRKPGYTICEVSTEVVTPIVYNSTVIRTNDATSQLPNHKIFVVGDGPTENPNFLQTWVVGNIGIGNENKAKDANSDNTPGQLCYDNSFDNCMTYGPLYNWLTAVNRYNPDALQDYVLPTNGQIKELTDYISLIGYSSPTYYFNNLPFNLDNRRGGYFGFDSPASSVGQMDFRSLYELAVFWTGTRNPQDNDFAQAYSYNENSGLFQINAKANSYFSVRLIEKPTE